MARKKKSGEGEFFDKRRLMEARKVSSDALGTYMAARKWADEVEPGNEKLYSGLIKRAADATEEHAKTAESIALDAKIDNDSFIDDIVEYAKQARALTLGAKLLFKEEGGGES